MSRSEEIENVAEALIETKSTLDVRRAKLKLAASLRAQLAYEQNLERIDYRLDVIEPAQDEIERQAALGKKPVVELEASDASDS